MAPALVLSIAVLAIYMPMFGATLAIVMILEVLVLNRIGWLRRRLGLRSDKGEEFVAQNTLYSDEWISRSAKLGNEALTRAT